MNKVLKKRNKENQAGVSDRQGHKGGFIKVYKSGIISMAYWLAGCGAIP
jgi:hypothetical protein